MKPTKCPAKEKNWGNESERKGEERKQKDKVKTAVSLLTPKTRNFDFCTCPNFASWYLECGSESREMHDLQIALW